MGIKLSSKAGNQCWISPMTSDFHDLALICIFRFLSFGEPEQRTYLHEVAKL
jgi:hypothetical protein